MDIDTIIERVRGLDGPDREVDRDVHVLLVGPVIDFPLSGPWQENGIAAVPAYTASLDAVVALIERELPGFLWRIGTDGPDDAPFGWVGRDDEAGHLAATPTLAILLAFLTARNEKSDD